MGGTSQDLDENGDSVLDFPEYMEMLRSIDSKARWAVGRLFWVGPLISVPPRGGFRPLLRSLFVGVGGSEPFKLDPTNRMPIRSLFCHGNPLGILVGDKSPKAVTRQFSSFLFLMRLLFHRNRSPCNSSVFGRLGDAMGHWGRWLVIFSGTLSWFPLNTKRSKGFPKDTGTQPCDRN